MNLRLVWLFLSAIPDLIKLLQAIEDAQKQAKLDKKVTDDLKTIHQAYANKDADAITALFSGSASSAPANGTPAS